MKAPSASSIINIGEGRGIVQRRAGETSESLSLSNPKCIKGKFSLTEQNLSVANFKEGFWGALEGFFFVMEIQPDLILGSRGPFKGSDKAAAGWVSSPENRAQSIYHSVEDQMASPLPLSPWKQEAIINAFYRHFRVGPGK